MMQFQVRPKDEAENERVQNALFILGYYWMPTAECGLIPPHEKVRVARPVVDKIIYATDSGLLGFTDPEYPPSEVKYPIANIDKIIAEAEKRKPMPTIDEILDRACGEADDGMKTATRNEIRHVTVDQAVENAKKFGLHQPIAVHGEPIGEDEALSAVMREVARTASGIESFMKEQNAATRALHRLGHSYNPETGEWEPSSKKSLKPFWMVVNPQGSAPKVRHDTEAKAKIEAARIAKIELNNEIIVVKAVASYTGRVNVSLSTPEEEGKA